MSCSARLTRSQANSTTDDPRTGVDEMGNTLPADTPEWDKSVFNLLHGAIIIMHRVAHYLYYIILTV